MKAQDEITVLGVKIVLTAGDESEQQDVVFLVESCLQR